MVELCVKRTSRVFKRPRKTRFSDQIRPPASLHTISKLSPSHEFGRREPANPLAFTAVTTYSPQMNSTPWFAIFDWDGVIVDSSRQHEQAWRLIAREERRLLPADFFRRSFGMKNERVIPELLQWTEDALEVQRLSLRKEEIFRELIQVQRLQPLPGVINFLTALHQAKVHCAVASSTPRKNISAVIEGLGLQHFFRAIVCGEDVSRGKPDPEVFLTAASRLAARPEQSVVFEDAHVGVEAARRAGMKVVAVATTHPADTLKDADRVVHRLTELKVDELAEWFEAG